MQMYDPARRRHNGLPILSGFRATVLPRLTVFPCEAEGRAAVSAMVPAAGESRFTSRQVLREIDATDLPRILAAYRDDPEGALETLFGISLLLTEPSDSELARDLRRANDSETSISERAGPPRPRNVSVADAAASIEL